VQAYKNKSGRSGNAEFELGEDFINGRFANNPKVYSYTYQSVGRHHVESMKNLALNGEGLATYINQHPEVRQGYV